MTHIQLDYGKTLEFFDKHELDQQKDIVKTIHQTIHKGTGAGNDFLGWLDLPVDYDKEEFSRIVEASKRIKSNSDVLVVIGIGGSYLGARAAIEMLTSSFRTNTEYPEIVFVGNHLSSSYTKELLDYLQGNQQLHLDYLNNWLKKNMEKMKLRNVFLQRQINLKVHLNN